MVQDIDDIQKHLNNFKINTLLQLKELELKLNSSHKNNEELTKKVHNLEKKVVNNFEEVNQKFEVFKKEITHKTTLKIAFTILGATTSFLFATILRYIEHLY
jgi:predicted secreted Zn-dependent protease